MNKINRFAALGIDVEFDLYKTEISNGVWLFFVFSSQIQNSAAPGQKRGGGGGNPKIRDGGEGGKGK